VRKWVRFAISGAKATALRAAVFGLQRVHGNDRFQYRLSGATGRGEVLCLQRNGAVNGSLGSIDGRPMAAKLAKKHAQIS
jgi:hypothetical protein